MSEPVLPKEIWREAVKTLAPQSKEQAEYEARWLMKAFLGLEPTDIVTNRQKNIPDELLREFATATQRRAAGEPLAYILEEQEFCGRTFKINRNVLIPRQDTECLVELARNVKAKRVLDVGIGSGCIGLSIIAANSDAELVGLDISSEALAVATENAKRLDVIRRATLKKADACDSEALTQKLGGHFFDLIVANPPYLTEKDDEVEESVRRFEPHVALFSKEGGLYHIKTWLKNLVDFLEPRGVMAFEIGYTQGKPVLDLFRATGQFAEVYIVKDSAGKDRVVYGRKVDHG